MTTDKKPATSVEQTSDLDKMPPLPRPVKPWQMRCEIPQSLDEAHQAMLGELKDAREESAQLAEIILWYAKKLEKSK